MFMAGLFFLYLIVALLIFFNKRKIAIILGLLTMLLCLLMFLHHLTIKLPINL
jgi:hypothetical protein